MSLTAPVTNISRCSLHDGSGIRTVVFFKGCGLRCRWCHNPETLFPRQEILFVSSKCIGCGRCVSICPEHHSIREGKIIFTKEGCLTCGRCAEGCPTGALTLCGKEMTLEAVLEELLKDQHYYEISGGGITLSGGECLLHSNFAAALLKKCRAIGIHTAIESAMFVPWQAVEKVLPFVDVFFLDLKLPDPDRHREYTGQANQCILENIRRLSYTVTKKITIRIPMIPGVNDRPEDLRQFGELISSLGPGIAAVELLRYNNLAESKYRISGRTYESFAPEPQSDEIMNSLVTELRRYLPVFLHVFTRK